MGTCALGYGGQKLTKSVFLGHLLTLTLFTKVGFSLPELSPELVNSSPLPLQAPIPSPLLSLGLQERYHTHSALI